MISMVIIKQICDERAVRRCINEQIVTDVYDVRAGIYGNHNTDNLLFCDITIREYTEILLIFVV